MKKLVHRARLALGRRHIASALGGFEKAQRRLQRGLSAIDSTIDFTRSQLHRAKERFADTIDRAKVQLDREEATHTNAIDTLVAERERNARVHERLKQFLG
jgi:hypothetical protein